MLSHINNKAFQLPVRTLACFGTVSLGQKIQGNGINEHRLALHGQRRDLHVIESIAEMRKVNNSELGKSKGFVPTMGSLHSGHLTLINEARKENDVVVASIFVNNSQFAPHEDYSKYPRQMENDLRLLKEHDVDYVFAPTQLEMYPGSKEGATSTQVANTFINLKGIDEQSEGKARPGFFRGVATVVAKLFNIVEPTDAYFGQKDGLQSIVIRQLVRELNFNINVHICPTSREEDGLAMSSRNIYLSENQRLVAPKLYKGLQLVEKNAKEGNKSAKQLREVGLNELSKEDAWKVEYLSICDLNNGIEINDDEIIKADRPIMISSAVNFGNCRILDNIMLNKDN